IIFPIATAAEPIDESLLYGHWMSCDEDVVIRGQAQFPEAWYERFGEGGRSVGIWLVRDNPEVHINQWEIRYENGYPEILYTSINGGQDERFRILSLGRSMVSLLDS
ncbi:hypothetical protein RZS08_04075, partial [Arthrospira platensis SPKY1]|nr:hypothetical protein [Arthrospira platensis SPKY1]